MERASYIQGLRELAQFFEDHPELEKLPFEGILSPFTVFNAKKDEIALAARAFGKAEKKFDEFRFELVKKFDSGVKLRYYTSREAVCEKVVVGTKMEPTRVIPSIFTPERVIEAHEVEVVEWRCGSLLAPDEEAVEPVSAATVEKSDAISF